MKQHDKKHQPFKIKNCISCEETDAYYWHKTYGNHVDKHNIIDVQNVASQHFINKHETT